MVLRQEEQCISRVESQAGSVKLRDAMPNWKDTPIHVLDFEGGARTGIVEYGVATLWGGEVVAARTRLCAAAAPIPALDTQCHGIRARDVAHAAPFAADGEIFLSLRESGLLAAHHAQVEQGMLKAVWPYPRAVRDFASPGAPAVVDWGPWVDTHRLAVNWHPSLAEHKLGSLMRWFSLEKRLEKLADRHCPPGRKRYHCALYDALAAALLLRHLCSTSERAGITLETLVRDSLTGSRAAERMQGEFDLFS